MSDPTTPVTPREPSHAEVRAAARAAFMKRLLLSVLGLAVMVMLVASSYAAVATRQTQLQNEDRAQATNSAATAAKRGTARIEACTTPGRKCFDDGQARTGSLLGNVYQVQIASASYAAACAAKGLADSDKILACVMGEFAKHKPNPLKP